MDEPSELPVQEILDLACARSRQRRQQLERTGEGFNIFDAVAPKRYEETHSDFLADLLDPKGGHYQGSMFLELFIDELRRSNGAILPPNSHLDLEHARVRREGNYQEWVAKPTAEGDANDESGSGAAAGDDESAPRYEQSRRRYADLWIDTPRMLMIVELKYQDDPKAKQLRIHREALECWCGKRPAFLVLLAPASDHETFHVDDPHLIRMQYQRATGGQPRASVSDWIDECRERATDKPTLYYPLKQYHEALERYPGQPRKRHLAMAQDDLLYDMQSADRFGAACHIAKALPAMRARIAAQCGDAICRAVAHRMGEPEWIVDARDESSRSQIEDNLVKSQTKQTGMDPRKLALLAIDCGTIAEYPIEFGIYLTAKYKLTYKAFAHRQAASWKSGHGISGPKYDELPARHRVEQVVDEYRRVFGDAGEPLYNFKPKGAIFRIETGIDFHEFERCRSLVDHPQESVVTERAAELFVALYNAVKDDEPSATTGN